MVADVKSDVLTQVVCTVESEHSSTAVGHVISDVTSNNNSDGVVWMREEEGEGKG